MTTARLPDVALKKLKASHSIAVGNLEFYTCLYDALDNAPEREHVGQAMAQKQSFMGAVEAILQNHGVDVLDNSKPLAGDDCDSILEDPELGEHLVQEDMFSKALEGCITSLEDELTIGLLKDHLKAAELAVASIKSTSLKI